MDRGVVVALLLGVLQGVLEWLPVSSEGFVTVALTGVGATPGAAVEFALFLHAGTGVAAAGYYREELFAAVRATPDWRPRSAFRGDTAEVSFLAVATATSALVGFVAFLLLDAVVGALTGGAFVALIGGLLVVTGLLQRTATGVTLGGREHPDAVDAVLVGGLQGLAVLPGVSRSGTTASALLLRGHDGPEAFRLSFLLSIPAALGAGVLVVLETGGLPVLAPVQAVAALGSAAVVGYLTIDVLMRAVRRVAFWGVCVGLGSLAVLGGALVVAW